MGTTILQNVVESKRCTATATDDTYNYNVSYEVTDNGKTLSIININATKTDGTYVGCMSYQNGNKNISAADKVDTKVLATILDAILAEVQAQLITE
jgi:hypothetical protein